MDRKRFLYSLAISLLLSLPGVSRGAEVTHLGTDFLFGFLENYYTTQDYTVAIVNPDPVLAVSATVSIPGLATPFNATVIVPPAGSREVSLPASFNDGNEVLGISVTADRPVSVTGLSSTGFTGAGFLALPVPVLGVDYFVLSYAGSNINSRTKSTLMVIAAQDATTVDIVTPVDTQATSAGVPHSVVLNRLQALTLIATGSGDLTGARVQASAPVAVLGGSLCSWVPAENTGYCDQLAEEMVPVTAWGTRYVGAAFADRGEGGDIVRILATEDNTTVTLPQIPVSYTLGMGQFLTLDVAAGATFEIQSTAPVGVAQYDKGSQSVATGDPSMTMLADATRFLSSYDVWVPSGFNSNYAAVTLPTGATLTIDGTPASTTGFAAVGASGYIAGSVPLAAGAHRLTGSAPFGLQVYGSRNAEGYGYPAGYLFAIIPDDSGGGGGGGCFLHALGGSR